MYLKRRKGIDTPAEMVGKRKYEHRKILTINIEEEEYNKIISFVGEGNVSQYFSWLIKESDGRLIEQIQQLSDELIALHKLVADLKLQIPKTSQTTFDERAIKEEIWKQFELYKAHCSKLNMEGVISWVDLRIKRYSLKQTPYELAKELLEKEN